jgi:hypothetical protein
MYPVTRKEFLRSISVTEYCTLVQYTECQAFFIVVRIGSPSPARSVAPPTFGSKGGDTLSWGEGVGEPYFDVVTDNLVLYVLYEKYFSNI